MNSTFKDRLSTALNGRKPAWLSKEIGIPASTLTGYRKGSLPSADVVFRLADALGVDARWLVTGHGNPVPASAEPVRSVSDVTRRLDEIEARLEELPDVRAGVEAPEFKGLRAELSGLAVDEALPERLRSRADLVLRVVYEDAEAEARQERRARRVRADLRRQRMLVDDVIATLDWSPSPVTREVLLGLVSQYNLDEAALAVLLREIRRLTVDQFVASGANSSGGEEVR